MGKMLRVSGRSSRTAVSIWNGASVLACGAMLLLAGGARAQTTGAPTPDNQAGASDAGIDSGAIVVTAQRRQEDIKNVPLSVSVLGGKQMEIQKLQNFEDLGRIVPGLAIYNTGSSNLSRITIRGISSTQGTSTVGIYMDDVPITTPNLFFTGATLPKFFDLKDLEVLRGPQGTLFGSSSQGGTLRFITNKPDLERFGGDILVDGSDTAHAGGNYLIQGAINIPLVADKLALRVAALREDDAGYVDRIDGAGTVHKGVNNEVSTAVRATLLFKASDVLSFTPALMWQQIKSDGNSLFYLNLPDYQQTKLSGEPNTDRLLVPSLTARADWDGVQLTSVTAYLRRENDRVLDGQIYNSQYLAGVLDPAHGTIYNTIRGLTAPYINDAVAKQWTQEIRLGSKSIAESHHRYEWQVGGYFSSQNVPTTDLEYINGLGSTLTTLYPGRTPSQVLGATLPADDQIGYFLYFTKRREFAAFAEGSYEIFNGLKATIGVRQSWSRVSYGMDEGGWRALGLPTGVRKASNATPTTPKFALTYTASKEATLYANISKGYRLGGFNSPLPSTCGPSLTAAGLSPTGTYTPDSLWSYEAGGKFRFFRNRLSVNASIYQIDWDNIQQSVSLPSCGYVTTVNAGKARSRGGEIEISAKLTPHLTLNFSGAIVNARITDPAAGSGTTLHERLINVPKSNFNGGFDYETPLSTEINGFFHFDVDYVGSSLGNFTVSNIDHFRPSYTTLNLNTGTRFGRYELSIYVRNLLDEDKIIQRPQVVSVRQGLIIRPRTIGAQLRAHF